MALADNLTAYWSCDEASGNLLDAHGSNHLVETDGTIAATTGKVSGARELRKADTEHFELADNATISVGNIDFMWAGWVYLVNTSGDHRIWGQWDYGTDQRSHFLMYSNATSRFQFLVSLDGVGGGSVGTVAASSFGAPSAATWYFVVVWHDSGGNTINICVNDGPVDSTSWSSGVHNSTAPFAVGAMFNVSAAADGVYADIRIDELGFWKGRYLTASEITEIYNAGSGRNYAYITGGSPPAGNRRRSYPLGVNLGMNLGLQKLCG